MTLFHHTTLRRDVSRGRALAATRYDDVVLAVLMLSVGAPRVALAIAEREDFGVQSTLAAMMTVAAIALLVSREPRP